MTEYNKVAHARYFLNHMENCCRQEETSWSPLSKALKIADPSAQHELEAAEARIILEKLLPYLKERERHIINCRFFDDLTLSETAHQVNISLERVRQIQFDALSKLRRMVRERE